MGDVLFKTFLPVKIVKDSFFSFLPFVLVVMGYCAQRQGHDNPSPLLFVLLPGVFNQQEIYEQWYQIMGFGSLF